MEVIFKAVGIIEFIVRTSIKLKYFLGALPQHKLFSRLLLHPYRIPLLSILSLLRFYFIAAITIFYQTISPTLIAFAQPFFVYIKPQQFIVTTALLKHSNIFIKMVTKKLQKQNKQQLIDLLSS